MENENETISRYRNRGIHFFFGEEERALFQVIRALWGEYPYYWKETMNIMPDINGGARFYDITAHWIEKGYFEFELLESYNLTCQKKQKK